MKNCNATCPHGTQKCTDKPGHAGEHHVFGDVYPGARADKSICTFDKETA